MEKIITLIKEEPELSAKEIGVRLVLTPRVIEKQIAALKTSGKIKRRGPAKGDYWEVMD